MILQESFAFVLCYAWRLRKTCYFTECNRNLQINFLISMTYVANSSLMGVLMFIEYFPIIEVTFACSSLQYIYSFGWPPSSRYELSTSPLLASISSLLPRWKLPGDWANAALALRRSPLDSNPFAIHECEWLTLLYFVLFVLVMCCWKKPSSAALEIESRDAKADFSCSSRRFSEAKATGVAFFALAFFHWVLDWLVSFAAGATTQVSGRRGFFGRRLASWGACMLWMEDPGASAQVSRGRTIRLASRSSTPLTPAWKPPLKLIQWLRMIIVNLSSFQLLYVTNKLQTLISFMRIGCSAVVLITFAAYV